MEGAGKGELLNLLFEWMDARHLATRAFGLPTEEEAERPEYWRYWMALPPKGQVAVYLGSWYTAPIVSRVMGDSTDAELDSAMQRAADFERSLANDGTLIIKLWLHISEKEQKRRFKELSKSKRTAWRVTKDDWKKHSHYDEFRKVCERAIRHTSTGQCPWTVIEGTDARYRNATAAQHIVDRLTERLDAPAVEGVRQVPVRLRHDNHSALTSIQGLPAGASLQRPVDMHLRRVALPPDGLVLGDYLAQRLGVKPGDLVWVEVLEGRQKKLQLPVVQLVQAYTGLPAYMDLQALNRALGDDDVVSGALLTVDAAAQTRVLHELDRRPRVAGAETRLGAVRAFFKSIAEFTGVFTWIAVLMGGVVNFGVVYNSARIALSERGRELASLRVLGLTQGEVSTILLGELALLVLVSIPLSFVVGWGLSAFLARGMQSDLYRVPVVLPPSSYAFAALITVLSAVLSSLAVYWRIRRLDLIGVLKTRE